MNLVARYGGEPVDFTIGNGSVGLLLIGGDFRSDLVVSGATRFVFVRPRPGPLISGARPRWVTYGAPSPRIAPAPAASGDL
jgi:hypothetical protein